MLSYKASILAFVKSKYRLTDCFSEDIFFYLYHAKDVENRAYVVCVYKAAYISVDLSRELIGMAEKLVMLSHPNLLNVIDYDYDGQYFYVVYEGLEGRFL